MKYIPKMMLIFKKRLFYTEAQEWLQGEEMNPFIALSDGIFGGQSPQSAEKQPSVPTLSAPRAVIKKARQIIERFGRRKMPNTSLAN